MRARGSPPRGRGAPVSAPSGQRVLRFTPAWAGSTPMFPNGICANPVHPRVGGEHPQIQTRTRSNAGSPPRGRGALCRRHRKSWQDRFTPAWAGSTWSHRTGWSPAAVHPRVGGEHSPRMLVTSPRIGSPPRGRGARRHRARRAVGRRFTPAWAGSTGFTRFLASVSTVHPRVGGEHPPLDRIGVIRSRFTPAWAGSTYRAIQSNGHYAVHPRVGGEHGGSGGGDLHPTGSPPRGRGALW